MARSYRAPLASRVVGAKRTEEPSIRARKRSERDDAAKLAEALGAASKARPARKGDDDEQEEKPRRSRPVATFVPIQERGGRSRMVVVPPEIGDAVKGAKRRLRAGQELRPS